MWEDMYSTYSLMIVLCIEFLYVLRRKEELILTCLLKSDVVIIDHLGTYSSVDLFYMLIYPMGIRLLGLAS